LNILFVGDIFGSAGRRIVREHIGHVREAHQVDLTIVNVENAAGGFGVTPGLAEEVFDLGADVLTTGNHVWDKKELLDYLNSAAPNTHDRARRIVRPANFPPGSEERRVGRERRTVCRSRWRSEEHTSELQSPNCISYAVFCLR